MSRPITTLLLLATATSVNAADPVVHRVESEYQSKPVEIHVLVPESPRAERLRVLYVLPVEAGNGRRWGNALAEVAKHRLHDRHDLVVVYPTFAALPWYTDHPTDRTLRQESHLLKVVLPFVEERYPVVAGRRGRLLVGFSKSGWGALSLLLRNPDTFDRAAAWDAPLVMTEPMYGSAPIFGTIENMHAHEPARLLAQQGRKLGDRPRLLHLGYDNFRTHHRRFEALLGEQDVPHAYFDGPKRKHAWDSGWLPEAVDWLARPTSADAE